MLDILNQLIDIAKTSGEVENLSYTPENKTIEIHLFRTVQEFASHIKRFSNTDETVEEIIADCKESFYNFKKWDMVSMYSELCITLFFKNTNQVENIRIVNYTKFHKVTLDINKKEFMSEIGLSLSEAHKRGDTSLEIELVKKYVAKNSKLIALDGVPILVKQVFDAEYKEEVALIEEQKYFKRYGESSNIFGANEGVNLSTLRSIISSKGDMKDFEILADGVRFENFYDYDEYSVARVGMLKSDKYRFAHLRNLRVFKNTAESLLLLAIKNHRYNVDFTYHTNFFTYKFSCDEDYLLAFLSLDLDSYFAKYGDNHILKLMSLTISSGDLYDNFISELVEIKPIFHEDNDFDDIKYRTLSIDKKFEVENYYKYIK